MRLFTRSAPILPRLGVGLGSFGRSGASFWLLFAPVFGHVWSQGRLQDAPNVARGALSAPKVLQVAPGASQIVDLGRLWCPQGFISSTFGVSRSYFFPTRAGSPAHAASMFTQGESKGDERRTRVGREEDERRTRGGRTEDKRRTRGGSAEDEKRTREGRWRK